MAKEYFSHDYNARSSLRAIRLDFGMAAVGFYWCCVEILHEEGGYIKESNIKALAKEFGVKNNLAEAVLLSDLFERENGLITSHRVLRNIDKRESLSEARKAARACRDRKETKDAYGQYHNVLLTAEELTALRTEFTNADEAIEFLSAYIVDNPKYKDRNHYQSIKRWVLDAVKEKKIKAKELEQRERRAADFAIKGRKARNMMTRETTNDDIVATFNLDTINV